MTAPPADQWFVDHVRAADEVIDFCAGAGGSDDLHWPHRITVGPVQVITPNAHQLPERLQHTWRKRVLNPRDGLRGRYVSLHGGSPFDLADRPEGSHWERTEQEDRRPQVLRATGQPHSILPHAEGFQKPVSTLSGEDQGVHQSGVSPRTEGWGPVNPIKRGVSPAKS